MRYIARMILLLALPLSAFAVPNTINYQGRLLDNNGIPITQTGMAMVVSIWTAASAGTQLYTENQTVNVSDGVYSFQIGGGTGGTPAWSPSTLFNTASPRFVELKVQGQTLTPRFQLLSAPFTLQSGNSDNLGGQPINYFGTVSTETSLQNQITLLNNIVSCNQHINEKWSVNNGFCFGGPVAFAGCKGKDFSGENFPAVLVTSSDCSNAAFKNADFTGATFTGTTSLKSADFSNAIMTNVVFKSSTDLTGATSAGNVGATTIIWNLGVRCPDGYLTSKAGDSCLQHGWVTAG